MGDQERRSETSRLADELWGSRQDDGLPIGVSPPAARSWDVGAGDDGAPARGPLRDPGGTLGDPDEPASRPGASASSDVEDSGGHDDDTDDTGSAPSQQPEQTGPVNAGWVAAADLEMLRSELEQAGVVAGVAAAEAHVADRLDGLSRQVTDLAARMVAPTTSAQSGEARLAALAQHVESLQVKPGESVGRWDVEALRSELEAGLADQLAQVRAEVAEAIAAAEQRMNERLDRQRGERSAEPAAGSLQSQVEALTAQLAWARSEIETTVAATEAIAVAAETRLAQRLEAVVERARSEASAAAAVERAPSVESTGAKGRAKNRSGSPDRRG